MTVVAIEGRLLDLVEGGSGWGYPLGATIENVIHDVRQDLVTRRAHGAMGSCWMMNFPSRTPREDGKRARRHEADGPRQRDRRDSCGNSAPPLPSVIRISAPDSRPARLNPEQYAIARSLSEGRVGDIRHNAGEIRLFFEFGLHKWICDAINIGIGHLLFRWANIHVEMTRKRRMSKIIRPTRRPAGGSGNPGKTTVRRSLSDQVAQRISDEYIMSGRTEAGQLLPSEGDLSNIYKVSRVTIRAAIRSLWDHGLISVRNGVGALVLPRAREVRHGLDRLASIDTFAREIGHKVETGHLQWEDTTADAEISRKLQIPVGAPVLQVKRSKMVNGEPVAWIVDTVPLGGIDEKTLRKQFSGSVLDVFLEDGRYQIDYADSEVKPCLAKGAVKEILKGDADGLLLFLDSIIMTMDGSPILWGQIWLDPTHFRFSFNRRRFR